MLLGLGWPWWSANAERGELARARPAPAAVRRKLRREGVNRVSPTGGLAADVNWGGRADFFRFIRFSLDRAWQAPDPAAGSSGYGLVAGPGEVISIAEKRKEAKSTVKR